MSDVFIILIVLACALLPLLLLVVSCKRTVRKNIANHNSVVNRKTVVSVDVTMKNNADDDFVVEKISEAVLTDAVWADDEPKVFEFCCGDGSDKAGLEKVVNLIGDSCDTKKVFAIASFRPSVFVNTAIWLAKSGKKCLLVETDEQRKLLTKIFNIKTGRFSIRRGFYPTPIKQLFLAPHFSISNVLRSFELLRENFDVILICQPDKTHIVQDERMSENIDMQIVCKPI